MLVTSIFSFSHNVFKNLLSWGHENPELFGDELTMLLEQLVILLLFYVEELQFACKECC